MRTTLSIDDELAQGLMLATGQKTPVAAIRQALQEYLQQARKQEVLALRFGFGLPIKEVAETVNKSEGSVKMVDIEDRWRELRQAELAE